ncbi:AAA family ATPase [Pontiella sp.]|uniref:AAA family ATPase n=2 Tax=Pontiella sp. TaxID=2837462 RepID=UPI003561DEF6
MFSSQFIRDITLLRDGIESFGNYPFALPAIRSFDRMELHPGVTFIIGENGSGKSTLLEAIAVAAGFNPEGGTRNFSFSTRASHSELHRYLRIGRGINKPTDGFFLRAESFFNVATEIERMDAEPAFGPPIIDSYGGVSLHEQSHGESFLALVMNRFGGNGLYILDEPEAALSPQRQLTVLARMHDLIADHSQFIIATHSPIMMAYPDATIYDCSAEGLRRVEYTETEHYQVTHDFLINPDRVFSQLFRRE